jgi:hypothetical protein
LYVFHSSGHFARDANGIRCEIGTAGELLADVSNLPNQLTLNSTFLVLHA